MIDLYRYRLPFKDTFQSAGNRWNNREGLIIRFRDNETDLIAEAAPLPGFSTESLPELIEHTAARRDHLDRFSRTLNGPEQLSDWLQNDHLPSFQFAVSSLGLQLLSVRNPQKLLELTASNGTNRLAVNAVLGLQSSGRLLRDLELLSRQGYRTVKLKCGSDTESFMQLLDSVSGRFPGLRFRIDANQSWSFDESLTRLNELAEYPVEYCEEPCPFEDLEQAGELCRRSPVPIALDESIRSIGELERVLEIPAADIVIIKPMLFGDLPRLAGSLKGRPDKNIKVVVTTALESGVGRLSINRFASLIGSADLAHGLDTGRLFTDDLLTGVSGPVMTIPRNAPWCPDFDSCDTRFLTPVDNTRHS